MTFDNLLKDNPITSIPERPAEVRPIVDMANPIEAKIGPYYKNGEASQNSYNAFSEKNFINFDDPFLSIGGARPEQTWNLSGQNQEPGFLNLDRTSLYQGPAQITDLAFNTQQAGSGSALDGQYQGASPIDSTFNPSQIGALQLNLDQDIQQLVATELQLVSTELQMISTDLSQLQSMIESGAGSGAGSGSGSSTGDGNVGGSGSGSGSGSSAGDGNVGGSGSGSGSGSSTGDGNVGGSGSGSGSGSSTGDGNVGGSGSGSGSGSSTGDGNVEGSGGSGGDDNSAGTPSWANITKPSNNYDSPVPGSFYAEQIASNATYKPANIANPGASGVETDEGLMIDERGMNPADLRTVTVEEATGSWTSNDTNGKVLGTILVPDGVDLPRPITTYDDGVQTAHNNPVTIIQPDGEDMSFNKVDLEGNVLIGVQAGAHGGSFTGNYGALTEQEAVDAIQNGSAPQHALQMAISDLYIGKANSGKPEYPAVQAEPWYEGSNADVAMGSHLALPPNETPEELGVTSNLGKAVFKTLQEYGVYIVDGTSQSQNLVGLETGQGATEAIKTAAGTDPSGNSSDWSQFQQEFANMVAALDVVPPG